MEHRQGETSHLAVPALKWRGPNGPALSTTRLQTGPTPVFDSKHHAGGNGDEAS
ncbi:hypothetical protein D554_0694 [Bordetella holmesii 30539]|uniref:Uncharacterized protein n=2 Tax=Bordetella holmesii TaxID=35814 RepID=A0A158M9F6_9BORD|nr:hypothetical protein D560_1218 [Bordetella holmesii ATCC 51541]AIT25884.1 hypothetical protein D558_1206 [Bordetella holmesii 44057]EWM43564.1 hypothetical protein D556_1214 [Bordetella holmesii 41130]EWM46452.1 hypothetical protein D555_1227 [Bordetella holmesii 35009]EWM50617.1 hypothetical protein D557_0462 [Bordetella holmesii 70147]EXF89494.1 hypothetical protein D554_0694 [Bordetella holmesii 30539]EXX95702.1 hypothetical protein D559_3140 [Bordetella holmesii 1058]KAK79915.1 hypoth